MADEPRPPRPDAETPTGDGAPGPPSSDGGPGAAPAPSRAAVPSGDGGPAAPEETADAPARRRPWWEKGLIGAGAVVAVLVALVAVALFVLLGTEWGRQQVQGLVVGEIENLFVEEATVEVARLDGSFLRGARLTGLVVRYDGEVVVAVDTVLVDYNLLTLLDQRFSASELYVAGPTVYARQRADSTWNLATLLKPADPADTTASSFVVEVGAFAVARGQAEVRYYRPRGDSVLAVRDLAVEGSAFHTGPDSLTARLDGVRFTAVAPGEAARVDVAAAGRFGGDALALDDLRVTSAAGTDIRGEARVAFGGEGLPPLDADLALQPLALADVRAFTGVGLYGEPRVRLSAQTRDEGLAFSLQGAVSGGTVTLDGLLRSGAGRADRLEYRVQGQLRGLNPALITQNPALDGEVTGELQVDLAGTSPRTLDGPFTLLVTDSRVGRQPIERLAVDGAFRTGRVAFEAAAALPGARLVAEGEARPFDPTPTYDVEGVAEEFDLSRLLQRPGQSLAFSGAFALNGAGFTPRSATAEGRVELDDVRLGNVALETFDANAELRGGALRFVAATEVAGGGGTVEAVGTAQPFADPLAYTVTEGRMDGLDLAAVTGDPSRRSDLTGTFALDGRGTDLRTATVDLQASLRNSTYGVPDAEGALFLDVAALDVDGTLSGGTLAFDGAADLGRAGRVEAVGTARPFADRLAYQATGRVENLDLAALTGNPARQSDLTAAFDAEGAGTDPQTLDLTARLDLAPSSYGAQEVTDGTVRLQLQGGDLALTGDLTTPEGTFALDVSGRPFDETPSLAFGERTCFSGLDLAAVTGNPDLRSRLAGCLRGSLSGFDLATASGEGTLTLSGGTFNAAPIEDGVVRYDLDAGALDAAIDLTLGPAEGTPGGRLDLALAGRPFDETPTYALDGTASDLNLGALLGLEQPTVLSLRLDLTGRGTDPETMALDGVVALGSSRFGGVLVDTLVADLALDRGVLRVDTLFAESNVGEAVGGGRLVLTDRGAGPGADAPRTDFRLHADLDDLAPVNVYLAEPLSLGEGTVDVEVMGEVGGPLMYDVAVVAERLAYGETAMSGLDARVTGAYAPDTGALDVRTRLEFDYFARPGLLVEAGDLDVVYDGDVLVVEGDVTVDHTRDFQFAARLDFAAPEPAVEVERLTMNVDGEPWALAGPARIYYGGAYRVQNLLLRSEASDAQIAADGVIDPDGEQAFVLTIEGLQVGGITDLLGYDGLGGELTTSLLMTGPAASPALAGALRLDSLTSRGRPVGALDVTVDYDEARLGLDAALLHTSGQRLTAAGFLPIRFSLAGATTEGETAFTEGEDEDAVFLEVRADAFPVAWAKPFLDPDAYTALGGLLTADVTVSGTQSDPRLDGTALLEDGRLGLAAVGRVYETIVAPVRFAGNQALIEDARIVDPETGRVALTAEGTVTLPELSVGELDLEITPRRFVATDTRTYDGLVLDRAAEPIRLTGTLDRPFLRGAVVLAEGDIYLTDELLAEDFADVTLSDEDLRLVEARFGRRITERDTSVSRFTQALDLDLGVEIRRNVWLRSTSGLEFAIEFAGDVRAVKAPFAEGTNLYGTVQVVRGSVETLGRRFDLQRGTLTFNGPAEETLVDLVATLGIRTDPEVGTPSVEITLAVTGRLGQDLAVTLSSDPTLDNADIVSLIATGRLAEDFIGGGALASAGEGLLLGQLSGLVEGVAGNTFGLDVVQISQEPGGLVIKLGKYLTNRAFVTVGYPIGGSDERRDAAAQLTLEYTLLRWLLGQVEYEADVNGTGSSIGAGAIYEYTY